jgi:xylan 1,4-beta-xylosidase
MSDVPAFHGNINFNAQHAPVGAFMSFTCGHFGSGGGIGVEIGKPANQNLYIGVKRGGRSAVAPIKCLPFVRGASGFSSAAANFQVDQAQPAKPSASLDYYAADETRRHYGWASDTWATPDFSFAIYSPFTAIPEPGAADLDAMRDALLPAVLATLTVDNRGGAETKTAVFAIDFPDAGTRLLTMTSSDDAADDRSHVGFAWRRSMGVLGMLEGGGGAGSDGLFAFQRWSVAEGVADVNHVHELGSCGGIAVEVPPGQTRTLVLAIGVYLDGIVTTGLEGRYYYTRFYSSLDDVLAVALHRADKIRCDAMRLDRRLLTSRLSPDQQFLVSHGTRGYYGSTQLLEIGGEPFFIVNEGEYCMMNTLDLCIDHAFWELDHNPWVVRNILDNLARRYSYHDNVRAKGSSHLLPGGVSFCHDMGVNNNFARPGHSSYELAHLGGCFSYMTQEQLGNWILLASCYVAASGDSKWLVENAHLLAACTESLRNRADPRTGVMAYDTARCAGGQEITTYDSLDESLGQARANTYLAAKCWASWIGLEMLSELRRATTTTAGGDSVAPVESLASKLAHHLERSAGPDGVLPAVLERDNAGFKSRILPAAEALIYPHYWLDCLLNRAADASEELEPVIQQLRRALRGPWVDALRRHTVALLTDPQRRNLFDDGGIKLSSTSNNSWMSKIALFQYVTRQVLRLCEGDGADALQLANLFATADAAHVRWQTEGVSAFWACSDQMVKGVAKASRYYPRLITAALWLDEQPRKAATAPATPEPDIAAPLVP